MAESLRERLAAKSARRVTHPIATREPKAEYDAFQMAIVALSMHPPKGDDGHDPKVLGRLVKERNKARDAYQAIFVDVEFEALPADVYEQLLESHIDPDSDDDELVSDWPALLPELVAASCADEDLRDVDWWREQLGKPAWSAGDLIDLRVLLVRLNTEHPVKAPKD